MFTIVLTASKRVLPIVFLLAAAAGLAGAPWRVVSCAMEARVVEGEFQTRCRGEGQSCLECNQAGTCTWSVLTATGNLTLYWCPCIGNAHSEAAACYGVLSVNAATGKQLFWCTPTPGCCPEAHCSGTWNPGTWPWGDTWTVPCKCTE